MRKYLLRKALRKFLLRQVRRKAMRISLLRQVQRQVLHKFLQHKFLQHKFLQHKVLRKATRKAMRKRTHPFLRAARKGLPRGGDVGS
jgi:hypothetical protein